MGRQWNFFLKISDYTKEKSKGGTFMKKFKGTMLFTSHDYELVDTIANRIMEITPDGLIDRQMTYEEYLETTM